MFILPAQGRLCDRLSCFEADIFLVLRWTIRWVAAFHLPWTWRFNGLLGAWRKVWLDHKVKIKLGTGTWDHVSGYCGRASFECSIAGKSNLNAFNALTLFKLEDFCMPHHKWIMLCCYEGYCLQGGNLGGASEGYRFPHGSECQTRASVEDPMGRGDWLESAEADWELASHRTWIEDNEDHAKALFLLIFSKLKKEAAWSNCLDVCIFKARLMRPKLPQGSNAVSTQWDRAARSAQKVKRAEVSWALGLWKCNSSWERWAHLFGSSELLSSTTQVAVPSSRYQSEAFPSQSPSGNQLANAQQWSIYHNDIQLKQTTPSTPSSRCCSAPVPFVLFLDPSEVIDNLSCRGYPIKVPAQPLLERR